MSYVNRCQYWRQNLVSNISFVFDLLLLQTNIITFFYKLHKTVLLLFMLLDFHGVNIQIL